METIISPASAGRAGKAVQNDSGRKTVRNSLRSGRLVGTDGNIYALLGRARQALRRGGRPDLVEPMTKEVLASKSYEEAIGHICEYVEAE